MNQKTINKNTVNRKRNKKKKLPKTANIQKVNSFQTETFRVNRNFKDSLFRMLFDSRETLLSLYNAINCSDYRNPEELEITTINEVIYMGIKNDISFLIGSDMNLYEAQSTRNPNMPLRGLIYLAHLFEGYVSQNRLNLYGTRRISLPTPKYVVLYSGKQEEPDYKEYHLTDSFSGPGGCLECTAMVLNINTGHNQNILEQCHLLYEYGCFLDTVRQYSEKTSYTMAQAIDLAVTDCIKNGILTEFLSKHRAEVINVLLTEYDEDLHMKATYEEGHEDGLTEGREIGLAEGREIGLTEGKEIGLTEGKEIGLTEGKEIGLAEGLLSGIRSLISSNHRHNVSRENTLNDLILEYSLSQKQAVEYLDKYWQ